MDRMPIDHVYCIKLMANDVKPHVKVGDTFRDVTPADLDWTANDSVTFQPDNGFDVLIEFFDPRVPGGSAVDPQPPLGVQQIKDSLSRKVPMQAHQGGKPFGFHCSLINPTTHKTFGWAATKSAASGSPDGDVHN
jgi:hypothetical protein